jgi:hypothetical protein
MNTIGGEHHDRHLSAIPGLDHAITYHLRIGNVLQLQRVGHPLHRADPSRSQHARRFLLVAVALLGAQLLPALGHGLEPRSALVRLQVGKGEGDNRSERSHRRQDDNHRLKGE